MGDLPLWPPFPLAVNSLNSNQSFSVTTSANAPGVVPVYYIPSQRKSSADYCGIPYPSVDHQVQYMREVMYNAVFPSPVFCTPMAMVPLSLPQPVAPFIPNSKNELKSDFKTLPGHQRSASRATSVKAEPGSAIGYNISERCVNRTVDIADYKMVDSAPQDEGSSYSSSYSSFFKTDTGFSSNEDSAGENGRKDKKNTMSKILHPVRKCDPVWMQAVNVTPDLIYRYQMATVDLDEVLKADHKAMENVKQSDIVNEQLDELYRSMEDKQKSPTFNLYGSFSGSEHEYNNCSDKLRHESMTNSILMMIYEENASLPSPDI